MKEQINALRSLTLAILFCSSVTATAADQNKLPEDNIDQLLSAGEVIYTNPVACIACHLADASGNPALNAKDLRFGPSPLELNAALTSIPQMGPIAQQLNLQDDDLLALSVYLHKLGGKQLDSQVVSELRNSLAGISRVERDAGFIMTERDMAIERYASFKDVQENWQRKAKNGNIMHSYTTVMAETWPPSEPKFTPEPGKTYFYQNTGNRGDMFGQGFGDGAGNAVTVGDADTFEIIAQGKLSTELRGSVHTTAMTPDGRYGYIIGPSIKSSAPKQATKLKSADDLGVLAVSGRLNVPATLIKWDALSLEPVKMFSIGGRLHHMQIFQDKFMLVDTFSRDDEGLDVFLLDPASDQIVGGVRDEDLGGQSYTAFTDDKFIYILMQPHGYGPMSLSGYVGANMLNYGKVAMLRPFWVAKIDPRSWEVVREYPYPGYRGDWICFDATKENMFIPAAASSNVSKINLETGEIAWVNPTGIGPYGCNVNAENTELWVADKGEANGFFGRTLTVISSETGKGIATIPSGYMVDHVLLAPNGKEFWATSNAEGSIYVFDAANKELLTRIQIPGGGDAHGLPWVHYDQNGVPRVARDQGGFRNGINPRTGHKLDY